MNDENHIKLKWISRLVTMLNITNVMLPLLYTQNWIEKLAYPMSYTWFNLEKTQTGNIVRGVNNDMNPP